MRGQKAHAGFPEVSYGKFSSILVNKGYKVARVEQCAKAAKGKLVPRNIVSIITPGTRTHTYLDPTLQTEIVEPSYLFTVTERLIATEASTSSSSSSSTTSLNTGNGKESSSTGLAPVCEYGVCYVDSTTGSFKVGCFQDGPQRNRLRTLLGNVQNIENMKMK